MGSLQPHQACALLPCDLPKIGSNVAYVSFQQSPRRIPGVIVRRRARRRSRQRCRGVSGRTNLSQRRWDIGIVILTRECQAPQFAVGPTDTCARRGRRALHPGTGVLPERSPFSTLFGNLPRDALEYLTDLHVMSEGLSESRGKEIASALSQAKPRTTVYRFLARSPSK